MEEPPEILSSAEVVKEQEKEGEIQISHLEKKIKELRKQLDACFEETESLRKTFDKERKEMAKVFNEELQMHMERLIERIEILKKQNETLSEETKMQEIKIKVLEDLNKKQLLQFIDTSNIPEPLRLNRKSLLLKSLEDVKKIHKIRDRVSEQESRSSLCDSDSISCSSKASNLEVDSFDNSTPLSEVKTPKYFKGQDTNETASVSLGQGSSAENQETENVMKHLELNEDDCTESVGILKRSETLTSMDILERSLNKQAQKHVRISVAFDTKSFDFAEQEPLDNLDIEIKKIISSDKFLVQTPRNSSVLSSFDKLSNTLLDFLSDEKMLIKHSIISIEIEIISLELAPNSSLLMSDKTRFVYVEYSFLGYKGHLMETQSLPLPQKLSEPVFFRFTQSFDVNPIENEEQLRMLKSMVANNSTEAIKFMVIIEPIEDENGECEEIGFSLVKLNDLITSSTNSSETLKADVFSTSYPNDLIAFLDIRISGLAILRDLAQEI